MNEEQMLLAFIENLIKRAKTQHFIVNVESGHKTVPDSKLGMYKYVTTNRDTFSITFTDDKDPE